MNILIKLINDVKALCNTIITAVNAIKAKTDTITADLFTATHASRIDANISSRQANAGFTTTHSSRIDASISSRATQTSVDAIYSKVATGLGCVKSVQRGQVTLALNTDSVNVTVSSVDMSKCMIIVSGSPDTNSTAGAGGGAVGVYSSVVSNTVFSIVRTTKSASISGIIVGWQLVEYY